MKLHLNKDKTTKGTVRFKEDVADHPITIYLTKERYTTLDNPETLSLVIEKEG